MNIGGFDDDEDEDEFVTEIRKNFTIKEPISADKLLAQVSKCVEDEATAKGVSTIHDLYELGSLNKYILDGSDNNQTNDSKVYDDDAFTDDSNDSDDEDALTLADMSEEYRKHFFQWAERQTSHLDK